MRVFSKCLNRVGEQALSIRGEEHSPGNENENVSHSVLSLSLQPQRLQSVRLLCPWNSTGKSPRVGTFSKGSSQSRNQTWVSCIAGRFFTRWATKEAHNPGRGNSKYMALGFKHDKIVPGTARKPIRLQLEDERSTAVWSKKDFTHYFKLLNFYSERDWKAS